jgi:hypothetical protein
MEIIIILLFAVNGILWLYLHLSRSKHNKEITEKTMDQFPKLYIEKSGTQYYLFEKGTETFKCQSSTVDDLAVKYYEYTKSVMAFVQYNNEKFVFIEGESIEEDSITFKIEVK